MQGVYTFQGANWRISLLGDELQQKEEVLVAVVQQLRQNTLRRDSDHLT